MTGPVDAPWIQDLSPARAARADLALGLRLAVPRGPAAALRCAVTVLGVGWCVALLLFLAAVPGAVALRADRWVALTPEPVGPDDRWLPQSWVGSEQFVAVESQWSVEGRALHGTDLFAPDPANVPAPPGVSAFPRPGEIVVSPALARLFAEPDTTSLPTLAGTVVGEIAPAGLLGPDELRFYRGTAEPTPPALDRTMNSQLSLIAVGWGWPPNSQYGIRLDDPFAGPTAVLVVAGGTVLLLVAGGLLVLLARLDGAARARTAVRLRLLGVPEERRRRITLVRGVIVAAAGVALGVAGFGLLRAAAGALPIGATAFFPADLTVPSWAAATVVLAAGGPLIHHSVRHPAPPDPATEGPAPPRPYGAQLIVLLTAGATVALSVSAGRHTADTGRLAVGTMTLAVVAVLGSVAVLVPWMMDVLAGRRPALGDPRLVRSSGRPFGVAAGLLTAVLVLQAVAGATGPDDGELLGARADLVMTARTGVWVGATLLVLLLVVSALLATDLVGRSRPLVVTLLPAAVGVALAVSVAVVLAWTAGRATDLGVAVAPEAALAWEVGALLVMAAALGLAASAGAPHDRHRS